MKGKDELRVLIIKLDHIGDVVLLTPIFRAIKEVYIKAKIDVIVSKNAIDVLKNSPFITNIFAFELSDYDRNNIRSNEIIEKNYWVIRTIQDQRYDVSLCFRSDGRNLLIQKLIDAETKIAFTNDSIYQSFVDIKVLENKKKHAATSNFDLLKKINIKKPEHIYPEIFTSKEDEAWIELFLKISEITDEDFLLGISMGGGWKLNWWPSDYYRNLCEKIENSFPNIKLVFVGGKVEEDYFKWIQEKSPKRYISAMGKTTITQLARLAKQMDLIITNDGGPMHIMSTSQKPMISIFGPSPYKRFGPISSKATIVSLNQKCSPCPQFESNQQHVCENNICMKNISVDMIYKEFLKNYEKIKGAKK